MEDSLSAAGIAAAAFVATNVDDVVLLAALFSDPTIRRRSIVLGQFLGIGVLVLVSYVAARQALAIPPGWVALLGVVPLALGVMKWKSLKDGAERDEADDTSMWKHEHKAEQRLHSQVLAVFGITVANGGDNLGVYIPLFAGSASDITLYAIVFAILTGALCLLGYCAVNNPLVGNTVRRYGPVLLPSVLIALGIYILSGAVALID